MLLQVQNLQDLRVLRLVYYGKWWKVSIWPRWESCLYWTSKILSESLFAFCIFICSQKPSSQQYLLLYISVICTTATKVKKKYCAEIYHNFVSAFNFWSSTLHLKCVLHFPAAREGKGQMIIFNFSEVCTSWPNSFEIILLFHVNKSCCYSTECLYSTETVLGTEYSLL